MTPPLNCLNWESSNLLQVLFPPNLTKVIRLCKNDAILQHKARVNVEYFIFWWAICHTGSAIKSAWKTLQSLQSWDCLQLPTYCLLAQFNSLPLNFKIITLILWHLRSFAFFLACNTNRESPSRKKSTCVRKSHVCTWRTYYHDKGFFEKLPYCCKNGKAEAIEVMMGKRRGRGKREVGGANDDFTGS